MNLTSLRQHHLQYNCTLDHFANVDNMCYIALKESGFSEYIYS
jgi:hypothetical protein